MDFDGPERDVMHKPLHSIPLPLAMRQGPGCTRDHREARVMFVAWVIVALTAGVVLAAAIGG
jgi:hypothetical protein